MGTYLTWLLWHYKKSKLLVVQGDISPKYISWQTMCVPSHIEQELLCTSLRVVYVPRLITKLSLWCSERSGKQFILQLSVQSSLLRCPSHIFDCVISDWLKIISLHFLKLNWYYIVARGKGWADVIIGCVCCREELLELVSGSWVAGSRCCSVCRR